MLENEPALHSTFVRVNWTSFWAGMSFQVAKKTFFSMLPSSPKKTWMGTMQAK